MISIRFPLRFAFTAAAALAASACFGEVRSNPYTGIVDRNPFGLKPPPPPVVETPEEPVAPPPNVKLTGISNLFSKRALLEITELQAPARPGQPPPPTGTVNRPILAEGEAMFGVEVVAIDLEKNVVRIRNGGTESELTFEMPKPSGGPAAAPSPIGRTARTASTAPAIPAIGQPTIVSAAEPRGGVTMLGGGGGFAGNTAGVSTFGATTSGRGTTGGISTYGGMPMAGTPNRGFNTALNAGSGNPTIPSRTVRTATPAREPIDPDTQAIMMEAHRLHYQNQPKNYPPLPTTRLTPQVEDVPFPPPPGAR